MALSRWRIGQLIESTKETNATGMFGPDDVRGMTITKQIIPTKADVSTADLSKYLIIRPGEFVFNPRTHGKHIGFGYNDTNLSFIISWNNIGFCVREDMKKVISSEYLFLNFNRDEWDREACYRSWGSSTEVFSWDALCEMQLNLPSFSVQQKYVDIYKAMVANQQSYERGLEDLKLVCDGYIEDLRRKMPCYKIGLYIARYDVRNGKNGTKNVKGISTSKCFREPTSKVNKEDLANYKVCHPRQFAFVQTTHNEKVFTYAFNSTKQDIVVSSVNEVFSTDEKKLYPEYLCTFLNRTEFDRYARFHSWGSARETFTWNDLTAVEIPIPDIKIQRAIAEMYSVYNARKQINEQLKAQIKAICPVLIKGSLEEGKRS